jgi:hypothetical protein
VSVDLLKIRRARDGDCWFLIIVRDGETIIVAVSTRELKSYRRFLIAAADQATRVIFREEWRVIRAEALNEAWTKDAARQYRQLARGSRSQKSK